jgi:hypothetical protein
MPREIPLFATRRTETVRKKTPGRSVRNDGRDGDGRYVLSGRYVLLGGGFLGFAFS